MGDELTKKLHDLFAELRTCMRLEKRFAMLTLAEKLTVLLSVTIIVIVMLLLATQVVMYLMLGLAEYIGAAMGNTALGYFAAAGMVFVLLLVFYALRTRLVVNPLARFMTHLFNTTEPC